MNGCSQFTQSGQACRTIQVIEPDNTLVTGIIGSTDPTLDESGSTPIPYPNLTAQMQVLFTVPKASPNYRFEYLYVDALGITQPGSAAPPVPISQTIYGFTVDLAGIPLSTGYNLQWRVFVVDTVLGIIIDAPENLRLQLPDGATIFTATFINRRSSADYGFTELRVENLIDSSSSQVFVGPQVVAKTISDFTVIFNQAPTTGNYFLVARTP